jgi:hypothetical protein
MDWGKSIVVSFVLFAAFIGAIVTICVKQDVNLVSADYYKDEIAFQQQIERKRNTEALAEKPQVAIINNQLLIHFPQNVSVESGYVKLFRPSSSDLDQNFMLSSSGDSLRIFELSRTEAGAYRIKMNWTMQGKEYYLEKTITI